MAFEHGLQVFAIDVLHHDPAVTLRVGANVVQRDEVGVLQVQALLHAAAFDVEVAANPFERDLFARIAERVIDLAESTALNGAFDRVAVERFRFGAVLEAHRLAVLLPRFDLRRIECCLHDADRLALTC